MDPDVWNQIFRVLNSSHCLRFFGKCPQILHKMAALPTTSTSLVLILNSEFCFSFIVPNSAHESRLLMLAVSPSPWNWYFNSALLPACTFSLFSLPSPLSLLSSSLTFPLSLSPLFYLPFPFSPISPLSFSLPPSFLPLSLVNSLSMNIPCYLEV